MIKGIGIDIVAIERIEKLVKKHNDKFLQRTFTEKEIEYCKSKSHPAQHYAGRFAAKEALMKALGKPLTFKEIEIQNPFSSPPKIELTGKAKEMTEQLDSPTIFLSISHDHEYAIAQVVIG